MADAREAQDQGPDGREEASGGVAVPPIGATPIQSGPPASYPLCLNGHLITVGAGYCTACGAAASSGQSAPSDLVIAPQRMYPQVQGWQYPPPSYVPVAAPVSRYQYAPTYGIARRTTNGLAIASMILGILWIDWIGSILALIFGYVALGQIKRQDQDGRGMAITGIVLGWVGIGFLVLGIIIDFALFAGFLGL